MLPLSRRLCIILLVLLIHHSASAQSRLRIDSTDFVIAGIRENLDSSAVRRILGQPLAVERSSDAYDTQTNVFWRYRGILISLGSQNSVIAISLTSKRYSTKRGVRVGDSGETVLKAYGKPTKRLQDHWNYLDPDAELHAVKFVVTNNVVKSIFVGWLIDD